MRLIYWKDEGKSMTEKAWEQSDKPTPDLIYYDVYTGKYYYLYSAADFVSD